MRAMRSGLHLGVGDLVEVHTLSRARATGGASQRLSMWRDATDHEGVGGRGILSHYVGTSSDQCHGTSASSDV